MAPNKPVFLVIENSGPNNVRDILKVKLSTASQVCIAVAFVTQAGLGEILQPLRQVAANGKVRIITGLYQRFTEPRALQTLLDIQERTREHFSVRLSRDPHFHSKMYLISGTKQATAIIGSSNLTKDGLQSSGELNVMVSLPKSDSNYGKLTTAFEKDWEHRSVPLSASRIDRYIRKRKTTIQPRSLTERQLKTILGTETTHELARVEAKSNVRYWRDYNLGYVHAQTVRLISETTNWDDKHYDWYDTNSRHPYRIGDRIFVFDFNSNCLRLAEVMDYTYTPVPTRDGRHFVAYRTLRKKRLLKALWDQLREFGINKGNAKNTHYISLKLEKAMALIDKLWR